MVVVVVAVVEAEAEAEADLRRAHRRLDAALMSLRSRPSSVTAAAGQTIWRGTHARTHAHYLPVCCLN